MAVFFQKLNRFAVHSLSALNGVMGDKLQNTALGIGMNFYADNKILNLEPTNLLARYAAPNMPPSPKICILIHGLTDSEMTWAFPDKSDYGSLLAQDLNYTPFYVRYNTGLHISENGQSLAVLFETLYQNYPIAIDEICIIAHSMGGLVTHSACHYADEDGLEWSKKLKQLFLLATPHLGSYLEKFANVTTNILEKVPNWHTRLVGKVLNLRSAGIKDLRFGYLKEEDWKDQNPDRLLQNNKTRAQILPQTAYYVLSARLTQKEKHWISLLFGDILVSAKSATARSKHEAAFNFSEDNHYAFAKTNHTQLTTMTAVYERIKNWLLTKTSSSADTTLFYPPQ